MNNNYTIVIFGSGAIGATLGGWLSQNLHNVYLLARGENAKAIKSNGLILYENERKNSQTIPVNIIEDLRELEKINLIIIAVKNYDLEAVARDIYQKVDDKAIILALQNGVENLKLLPKYFSKIVYGVIVMSAWRDKPGVFGTRGKNQIVVGTPNNQNQDVLNLVTKKLNLSFPIKITTKYQDAAHSKLVLNIANSVFTLIEQNVDDDDYIFTLWKIFLNAYLECVDIVKAAGYQEHKIKGLPLWKTMEFAKNLDKKTALDNFRRDIKYSWLNSMAQDKLIRRKEQSELESLNGYLLDLAHQNDIKVPFNEVIYRLCKKAFSVVPYKPLHVDEVWNEIEKELK
jgi:2-dehydropantoate 2-reductase